MSTSGSQPPVGRIFNIQSYSVHDGPGIRDVVFFKGCPLRCRWCSNPESQDPQPEIGHNANRCLGVSECGRCVTACPVGCLSASSAGGPVIDRSACTACGRCEAACPARALECFGRDVSVDDVCEAIHHNDTFYHHSGGGVTLGGGDPLMQPEFAAALLQRFGEEGVHRAVETAGHASWEHALAVFAHADLLLYDIKHADSAVHKLHTGVGNEVILANLSCIAVERPELPIVVRTPVIPGFNDTVPAIAAIVDRIIAIPSVRQMELLPYHRFGVAKYGNMGREYHAPQAPEVETDRMAALQACAAAVEQARFPGAAGSVNPTGEVRA